MVRNLSGFGCRILAYDQFPNETVKPWATYVDGPTLAQESDIITLHGPLTPDTHHILNEQTLPYLKDGVFIVNTSRGALLDTAKVIRCLKSGKIGYLAIDVYEEEADYFLPRPVRQGADQPGLKDLPRGEFACASTQAYVLPTMENAIGRITVASFY